MLRRFKLFLAELSGHLPSPLRRALLDFAAFFIFSVWRPFARAIPFHLLRRLPFPSTVLGPPKGLCATAKEAYPGIDHHSPLRLGHEITRDRLPAVIGGEVHQIFVSQQRIQSPATSVSRIPNARVFGDCGAVITADDRLVADVSLEVTRAGFTHSVFSRFRLGKPKRLGGLSAVLSAGGRLNYFHWMMDVLPRLRLLQDAGIALNEVGHFLIGEVGAPFQKESAEALGIASERFVPCSPSAHFQCDELLVPSLPGVCGNPPAWVCEFLRETFLSKEPAGPITGHGRRIYVSRAGARFRRVLNEGEVIRALAAEGFEIVELESLSVRAQARLFAEADVVVAPHGAGCTNAVFCRPGTAFIELFSPRYVIACYWAVCSLRNLRYAYDVGKVSDPKNDAHYFTMIEDIDVDCERLLRTIDLCIALPSDSQGQAAHISSR